MSTSRRSFLLGLTSAPVGIVLTKVMPKETTAAPPQTQSESGFGKLMELHRAGYISNRSMARFFGLKKWR